MRGLREGEEVIIDTLVRAVHCDMCDSSTSGWSRFETKDFHMPTAGEIRESENYRRVKVENRFLDLCPLCYARYMEVKLHGAR